MTLADLLKSTRHYFWNLDFDEVEIPYLNSSLPLEPNIYSFETIWRHTKDKFYLPTSPEFALKKHLLAAKKSRRDPFRGCFSISHCFRDLESEGSYHTKEFLMLEWYEVNKIYLDLMTSVENYLDQFGFHPPFARFQLPPVLPDNEPDFNQFFLNRIEPQLGTDPVFITGYPAFLSPLAKSSESNVFSAHSERVTRSGQPEGSEHCKKCLTSDRFELYINKIEIANGCTENRDLISIKKSFESEKKHRQQNHLPLHPYSKDFIEISANLPPCCGVGLGLDRLLSILNTKK